MKKSAKTLLGLIVIAVVAGLTMTPTHSGNTPSTPRAEFPQARYTFDPVVEGTRVEYDFMVRNTGTATLEITKTKTD